MDRTRIRAKDERSGMICVTPFSKSQFKPPLKNSWGCQMIRPFSAGLMSSPHFRPIFGHGFQRHFEAATQQPTSLNPQIPLELRWKRWWKPSILRPLEVSGRPLRRRWICEGVQIFGLTPMVYMNEAFCKGSTQKTWLGCWRWARFRFRRCFDGLKIVAVSHRDGLDGCTQTCTHARHAQECTFLNLIIIWNININTKHQHLYQT